MKQRTRYIATDLDLIADVDLTDLAAALESRGLYSLSVFLHEGKWHARFSVVREPSSEEPESDMVEILDAVEALNKKHRSVWNKCSLREINIGYDCGSEPWAFNQGISAKSLGRMAALNAALRVTLYPPAKPVKVASTRKRK